MSHYYNQFQKYFSKHDQVCICGIDWDTHGYIRKITPQGIWLVQLNNQKEILYNWNCFEVVHHCGYLVKKIPSATAQELFTIKIKSYQIDAVEKYLGSCLSNTLHPSLGFLLQFKEWSGAEEFYFPKLNSHKIKLSITTESFLIDVGIKIEISLNRKRKIKTNIVTKHLDGSDLYQLFTKKQDKITIGYTGILCSNPTWEDNNVRWGGTIPSNLTDGLLLSAASSSKKIVEHLDAIEKYELERIETLRKCPVAAGDPYMFVGELVSRSKIWKGPQGYIFASPHGELFL